MSNVRRYFPTFLFVLWTLFVIGMYYYHHPAYLTCDEGVWSYCRDFYGWKTMISNVFFGPRAMYLYTLVVLYIAWMIWRGKREVHARLTPLWLLVWLFLFSLISLNLLFIYVPANVHIGVAFFFIQASVLAKLGLLVAAFMFSVLVGLSVGSWVLKWFGISLVALREPQGDKKGLAEQFLYELTTGWAVVSLLFFAVLAFGQFTSAVIVPLLIVCLVISRKELCEWIHIGLTHRFSLSFAPVSLTAFALLVIHVILGYSLLEAIIPFPMNWDGVYRYLNTVNLITADGHFITGVFPYPFELIMSIGPLVFRSMMVAVGFTWFAGLLAALAVYVLARKFLHVTAATLVAASFLSMPLVFYLLSIETKVDFAGLLYLLVGVLAALQWYTHRSAKWLMFAGMLVGFAVAVKLTSVFFAAAFVVMIATLLLVRIKVGLSKAVTTLLILGVAMLAPLTPWIGKHLVEAGGAVSFHTLTQGGYDGPDLGACSLNEEEHYVPLDSSEGWSSTGHREEIGRYWGYEPRTLTRYLTLPWLVTMSTTVNHPLVQIGPLFLVLLVASVLFYKRVRHELFIPLAVLTGTTLVIWALLGQAIIWYALAGLVTLLVLLGMAWQEHKPKSVPYRFIAGGWILCILVGLFFRVAIPAPQDKYDYLSGFITSEELQYHQPPGLQELADLINADLPSPKSPHYVYNVGSFIIYRIAHNDERIYNDHFMDGMMCLLEKNSNDYDATLNELKHIGFSYIIVNPDVTTIDSTPEGSLITKSEQAATFVNAMLEAGRLEQIATDDQQHVKHVAFRIL